MISTTCKVIEIIIWRLKMYKRNNKVVKCKDGFSMSVQASERNYSHPRDDVGPYSEVEVGRPSHYDIHLNPYAENPSEPTKTVYGWVPEEVLQLCIDSHGGMISGELPALAKTKIAMVRNE